MTSPYLSNPFVVPLFELLEETFEHVNGIYLDRGTSLFETLETISSVEASRPVSQNCATIAAQVKHVNFYLEVLEDYLLGKPVGDVDWGHIWRTTREVSPEAWDALRQQLHQTYQRLMTILKRLQAGELEGDLTYALGIVAHTAYHLGEIRQATCTVKS
jgi:hypothetical protein